MTDYEHRQMRCKASASFLHAGRRYRPLELIEGELPEKFKDMIEPAPPPKAPEPEPEKPRYANPPAHMRTKAKPLAPDESIADPFRSLG